MDPRLKCDRSDQCSCYFCWMVGIIIKLWVFCWFSAVRQVGIASLSLGGFAYLVRKQGGIIVLLTLLCRNSHLYSNCMYGFSFHVACSSVGCWIRKTIVFRVLLVLCEAFSLYFETAWLFSSYFIGMELVGVCYLDWPGGKGSDVPQWAFWGGSNPRLELVLVL